MDKFKIFHFRNAELKFFIAVNQVQKETSINGFLSNRKSSHIQTAIPM
jgi:hypothetical protein